MWSTSEVFCIFFAVQTSHMLHILRNTQLCIAQLLLMGPDWLRIMLYIVIISHHEVIIIFQMARVPEIPSDVSKEGKRTEFCLSLNH